MKRRTFIPTILMLLLAGVAVPSVVAQSGDARLPAVVKPKPKPKPTPTPPRRDEPAALPSSRPPARVPAIAFNQLVTAALDPTNSGIITTGIYYDDYLLKATDSDVFTIILQSPDPRVNVQVYNAKNQGLPTLRDPRSSEFKLDTPGGTLPESGEYRVRVYGVISDQSTGAVGYTLRINRTGLTEDGYRERLETITEAFRQEKNVDETISKLDQLINDDENRPGAYELLGVMHLYQRNDLNKAVSMMEKALKLGGAAIFSVSFDPVLGRRLQKKPDGKYDWTEVKSGWLRILPDQVTLTDASDEQQFIFNLNGAQIKEIGPQKGAQIPVIYIRPQTSQRHPFAFSPGTRRQEEADVILKLIKQYVPPRG